jgi:hypothetical protein
VIELDDIPDLFPKPTPPSPAATPAKCRRHVWLSFPDGSQLCDRCRVVRDPVMARRGKNNRNRGNAIEREVGKALGLRRVGQYGGPDDLTGELFAVQVKSGGSFSERYWSWLKAVPANAGQTPLLVVTDAPGAGHRRRALVVLELDEWIALHGPEGVTE